MKKFESIKYVPIRTIFLLHDHSEFMNFNDLTIKPQLFIFEILNTVLGTSRKYFWEDVFTQTIYFILFLARFLIPYSLDLLHFYLTTTSFESNLNTQNECLSNCFFIRKFHQKGFQ